MVVDCLAAFLKGIEFFENGYGDNDIVFVKVIYTGAVMENDIGVEDKDFLFLNHKNPG